LDEIQVKYQDQDKSPVADPSIPGLISDFETADASSHLTATASDAERVAGRRPHRARRRARRIEGSARGHEKASQWSIRDSRPLHPVHTEHRKRRENLFEAFLHRMAKARKVLVNAAHKLMGGGFDDRILAAHMYEEGGRSDMAVAARGAAYGVEGIDRHMRGVMGWVYGKTGAHDKASIQYEKAGNIPDAAHEAVLDGDHARADRLLGEGGIGLLSEVISHYETSGDMAHATELTLKRAQTHEGLGSTHDLASAFSEYMAVAGYEESHGSVGGSGNRYRDALRCYFKFQLSPPRARIPWERVKPIAGKVPKPEAEQEKESVLAWRANITGPDFWQYTPNNQSEAVLARAMNGLYR